jgi:hypothetical protein
MSNPSSSEPKPKAKAIQELDGRIPKLVTRLFRHGRTYSYDISNGIRGTDKAVSHHVFTFRDRPGWKIDAYQFGALGLSTELDCSVTTPWGQIEYRWFKSGLEFDDWTGSMNHSIMWCEMDECKNNTRKEIDSEGHITLYPPPVPDYIEGCECIDCNKDNYDGLVWEIEQRKEV